MNTFNSQLHEIYSFALKRLKQDESNLCCISILRTPGDGLLIDKALSIFKQLFKPKICFGISNDLFWPKENRQSRYSAMEHLMSLCEQNHFQP